MAALSSIDKVIVGYKPKGLRFRGNYWALSIWMNGEEIKPQYAPKTMTVLDKYGLNA